MIEPLSDERWEEIEREVRALVGAWDITHGGPPREPLAHALIETYRVLERREAQIFELAPKLGWAAPLVGTLQGLRREQAQLRLRVAELYDQWKAAHPETG